MANTYAQIYLHFVFAVQNRTSLIQSDWKNELYKYITGIVKTNGHKLIAIGGTSNHVHILIGYKQHQLIPELLQDIKGSSSKWINYKKLVRGKFSWQQGYGAFSYGKSQLDSNVKYMASQEQYHKRKKFRDEYLDILKKFNVPYNEKYILKEID
jgi:REP element-mobilizing transposase RayT